MILFSCNKHLKQLKWRWFLPVASSKTKELWETVHKHLLYCTMFLHFILKVLSCSGGFGEIYKWLNTKSSKSEVVYRYARNLTGNLFPHFGKTFIHRNWPKTCMCSLPNTRWATPHLHVNNVPPTLILISVSNSALQNTPKSGAWGGHFLLSWLDVTTEEPNTAPIWHLTQSTLWLQEVKTPFQSHNPPPPRHPVPILSRGFLSCRLGIRKCKFAQCYVAIKTNTQCVCSYGIV